MTKQLSKRIVLAAAAVALSAFQAKASLSVGPGGQGVTAGNSSLIKAYDYSDSFTGTDAGGHANRPFIAAVQPASAYVVESTYGHPSQNFHSPGQPAGVAEFSFAPDDLGIGHVLPEAPPYPGSSGAGSAGGFTQTGGSVDYSLNFGLRSKYVVQFDAVTSGDRIDITSGPATEGIFQANSVSIFFRATGGVSLFNGTTDTPVPGYDTGLTGGGKWHNYAALFDQDNKTVELFVDEASKGVIDLKTIANGLYQDFSNAAVGGGGGLGGGENRTWTDNFQVGGVPEPATLGMLGLGALAVFARRRRTV